MTESSQSLGQTWSIYVVHNTVNGKNYVGQTKRKPEIRWKEHRDNAYPKMMICRAIQKHGHENMSFDVVARAGDVFEANCLERFMIDLLGSHNPKTGYNATVGGHGLRQDFCKRGHDLRLPGARRNDGSRCRICSNMNSRNRERAWRIAFPEDYAAVLAASCARLSIKNKNLTEAERLLRNDKSRARYHAKKVTNVS